MDIYLLIGSGIVVAGLVFGAIGVGLVIAIVHAIVDRHSAFLLSPDHLREAAVPQRRSGTAGGSPD